MRCVPRIINVFVYLKDGFINRNKTITRFKLDAKSKYWFSNRATTVSNNKGQADIEINLFANYES